MKAFLFATFLCASILLGSKADAQATSADSLADELLSIRRTIVKTFLEELEGLREVLDNVLVNATNVDADGTDAAMLNLTELAAFSTETASMPANKDVHKERSYMEYLMGDTEVEALNLRCKRWELIVFILAILALAVVFWYMCGAGTEGQDFPEAPMGRVRELHVQTPQLIHKSDDEDDEIIIYERV